MSGSNSHLPATYHWLDSTPGVAVITLDDGKANALSPRLIDSVSAIVDKIESHPQLKALIITGRPGYFSAGFDLNSLAAGGPTTFELVTQTARLALRLYNFPKPVVMAVTGHALAMGALLALCGDFRLATDTSFKTGLNETRLGMTMPLFGIELARARLANNWLERCVSQAEILMPQEALQAGFYDTLVPEEALLEAAEQKARALAELNSHAFHRTRQRMRKATTDRILELLEADISGKLAD